MEKNNSFKNLYAKFLAGNLSPDEEILFWSHFSDNNIDLEIEKSFLKEFDNIPPLGWENQTKVKDALERVENNIFNPKTKTLPIQALHRSWWYIAATILIICSFSFFLYIQQGKRSSKETTILTSSDLPPASEKASIVFSDGTVLLLEKSKDGLVLDTEPHYRNGERLLKSPVENDVIIKTPKGGTYQVTLSDGTKIWLNADSKIVYNPTSIKKNREVFLEGEAYLEVVKDKQNPFIVNTKYQQIQVLGTEFNVSAYPEDQQTTTTLIQGIVDVCSIEETSSNDSASTAPTQTTCVRLFPGEQSQITNNTIEKRIVETNLYSAWKDGLIIFNNEPLEGVIKKIERWYDVEFEVDNWQKNITIEGEIPNDTNLSGILRILELYTSKKLKISERRIIETD